MAKSRPESIDVTYPGADLTAEEVAFGRHMHRMKLKERKPYPHFTDVLRWAKMLGYTRQTPGLDGTGGPAA
jgi:hypothetical protein